MNRILRVSLPPVLALVACFLPGRPALSCIVFHTNPTAFAVASGATVTATFDLQPGGPTLSFTEGMLRFSAPLDNLFILTPNYPQSNPPPISNSLACNDSEDIEIAFVAGPGYAIGFECVTNQFLPPVVTVYAPNGALMGSHTLSQPPNTRGFIGVTSSLPISKVRWQADGGPIEDTYLDNVWATIQAPVAVTGDPDAASRRFEFALPWPNPSWSETTVDFEIEAPARVVLDVFNTQGRRVKRLADEWFAAGRHARAWQGDDDQGQTVGTGVYFIRIQTGGLQATRRTVRVR